MAETGTGSFSEDISDLWGTTEDSPLEPPRPNGSNGSAAAANRKGHEPDPARTNGTHAHAHAAITDDDARDSVARLVDALAGHQVDVVRRSELHSMRSEMEDAFTHQLAVALFELLSASNDRFASVEDHIDQRLESVATRVTRSIDEQADRLATTIEAQRRLTTDLARSVRDELAEISDRFGAPVDALGGFQKEMRHEVGRLSDLVDTHNGEAARRSEAHAERMETTRTELAQQLQGSEARETAATEDLQQITERITSVQTDISALHEAIQDLKNEMSNLAQRTARPRSRWGWPADRRNAHTSRNEVAPE